MIKINVHVTQFYVLLCIFTHAITIHGTQEPIHSLPPTKQIELVAPFEFLHEHDSKCFVLVDPVPTVLTRNDMNDNGHIILQESRNSAIIKVAQPKNGIVHVIVNFESSCFIHHYEIKFHELANNGNRINIFENKATFSRINADNSRKTKTIVLKSKTIDKQLCTPKSSPRVRPNAVIQPQVEPVGKWNQKTLETILHEYTDTQDILQELKNQGYNQDNLTEQELRLPGKLSERQVRFIMDRLPVFDL